MNKSSLRIEFSTSLVLCSAFALGLSAAACSSSSDSGTPANQDAGPSAGGASSSAGGGTSTGGAKATGGGTGTGGVTGAGGKSGTGGKSAGGADGGGTGGVGGAGGSDSGAGGDGGACVPETLTLPTNVPSIIQTPAGVTLVHHFHASGTQDYKCTATAGVGDAGTTYGWTFVGPEAVLSDNCANHVGTHYAGPLGPTGPQWKITADGSIVQGAKKQASPVTGSIPELLLAGTEIAAGAFSGVTYIQRLDTTGGASPAAGDCAAGNVDEVRKVDYTADYYFYTGPTDAGPP